MTDVLYLTLFLTHHKFNSRVYAWCQPSSSLFCSFINLLKTREILFLEGLGWCRAFQFTQMPCVCMHVRTWGFGFRLRNAVSERSRGERGRDQIAETQLGLHCFAMHWLQGDRRIHNLVLGVWGALVTSLIRKRCPPWSWPPRGGQEWAPLRCCSLWLWYLWWCAHCKAEFMLGKGGRACLCQCEPSGRAPLSFSKPGEFRDCPNWKIHDVVHELCGKSCLPNYLRRAY